MTIQSIIGNVDIFSAAVAIAIGGGLTIIVTTALMRQSPKKLEYDYKLAHLAQEHRHAEQVQNNDIAREKALAQIASTREIEFKRIDSGMIDVKATREG